MKSGPLAGGKALSDRTESGTSRPRRIRGLDTAADVKRECASLCRAGRRGDIPAQDASRLANVLNLLLRVIEGADLEKRMAAIEQRLAERQAGP